MHMDIILKYFPKLSEHQIEQYRMLDELYKYWNERINVISRKDIDNLYEHHVLHSLGIAELIRFKPFPLAVRFLISGQEEDSPEFLWQSCSQSAVSK